MVTIKNKKTGIESQVSSEEWKKIQNNPIWKNVFAEVKGIEPKEVQKLKEAKTASDKTSNLAEKTEK